MNSFWSVINICEFFILIYSDCCRACTGEGELVTATEHDIATAIVERARTLNVQLIVLGRTLHQGASKLFRASVADQVIHQHPSASILLVD